MSDTQTLPVEACTTCGAQIVWAVTAKSNRPIPLNAEPVPHIPGALILVGARAFGRKALQDFLIDRGRAERETPSDWPAHVAHFATCPNAAHHRRRR